VRRSRPKGRFAHRPQLSLKRRRCFPQNESRPHYSTPSDSARPLTTTTRSPIAVDVLPLLPTSSIFPTSSQQAGRGIRHLPALSSSTRIDRKPKRRWNGCSRETQDECGEVGSEVRGESGWCVHSPDFSRSNKLEGRLRQVGGRSEGLQSENGEFELEQEWPLRPFWPENKRKTLNTRSAHSTEHSRDLGLVVRPFPSHPFMFECSLSSIPVGLLRFRYIWWRWKILGEWCGRHAGRNGRDEAFAGEQERAGTDGRVEKGHRGASLRPSASLPLLSSLNLITCTDASFRR
jgi:hypothetical protein